MGLQRLGFLFPHPMMQVTPEWTEIRSQCGKTFNWKPLIRYSGFHLHTLHPSEWVHGFLMGKTEIALNTVRWLARNQQNIFDLSLLDMNEAEMFRNLQAPFALAKSFGIHAGVTAGMAFHQQNSYKLISLFRSPFAKLSTDELNRNLDKLLKNVDVSFLNLESGTSEFTPTNYDLAIKWINTATSKALEYNVKTFFKIHTSSNQKNEKYGNFNFLPSHAIPEAGILPHTVFLYGINDERAPMYGNVNFHHIRDFMVAEKDRRPVWYYPETSYFCSIDIDAPLLLTDYLLTRANDTRFIAGHKIPGQLNFSTGQELGYWLFDWTFTLLNNPDYSLDPMIGLKLLKEDTESWQTILKYQNEYFIKKNVISIVSFSSLGDEMLTGLHETLKRNLLRDLKKNPELLQQEIQLLQDAVKNLPVELRIRNPELEAMWNITRLRVHHALFTRLAMAEPAKKQEHLNSAARLRLKAQESVDLLATQFNRYPEAMLFNEHQNPTAYKWGYAFPVRYLHYWAREEAAIQEDNYRFWFRSLYSIRDVIEGWVL
jgi:hypothetical protein